VTSLVPSLASTAKYRRVAFEEEKDLYRADLKQ